MLNACPVEVEVAPFELSAISVANFSAFQPFSFSASSSPMPDPFYLASADLSDI
jgi:hypothetical protein